MIHYLYNTLLTLFLVISSPYFLLRSLLQEAFRKELVQRLGFFPPLGLKGPVWVHAASVGEVFSTIPLLRRIKKEFPRCEIILTTMTRTGNDVAKQQIPEAAAVLFVPLDHPFFVGRMIERIQPKLLLIAETELWPNLLFSCKKRGIPVVLFNGRISDKSFPRYRFLKFFFKNYIHSISLLLMQTEKDRRRAIEIGASPERTRVSGNIKFDLTPPSFNPDEMKDMAGSLGLDGNETVFIAGSTHSGEEDVVITLFRELEKSYSHFSMILAPRHLDRLPEVEKILRKEGIPWTRRSSLPSGRNEPDSGNKERPRLILLDTMGELVRLYSLGALVFVGGSLVPVGGHNPLEPLFFKKCVLFGPHMSNFEEISRLLVETGGAIRVNGREDLFQQVKHLLDDETLRKEVGEKGYQILQENRGSTERIFEEIKPYLSQVRNGEGGMQDIKGVLPKRT
jgi:3-deoxy-D-manno-octulosonic-acid transferase